MQAVVLAGGLGTRLHPLTATTPKPMLPLLNRPFLEHLLRRLRGHGVTHALLTLHHHPELIKTHFDDGASVGLAMDYLVEERPLGTAGGVKALEGLLTGAFVVCNGDIYTDLDLGAAVAFHRRMGAQATIVLTHADDPTAFGMVETDAAGRILRFVEKPAPERVTTNWVNAGTYILEPDVLRYAPAGEHFMFEGGLFPRLLAEGEAVYAFRSDAYWTDMGTPAAYLRLHEDLLRGSAGGGLLGAPTRPGVWAGPACDVAETATLAPPLLLGAGCAIAADARLRGPLTLGDACTVEAGATASNAVVGRNSRLGAGAAVEGCILGEGVVVGPGARVGAGCVLGEGARVSAGGALPAGAILLPGATA